MKIRLYNSCEELPIRNFFRVFETGDLKHLIKGGKRRLSKSDVSALNDAWEGIMKEYELLTKDNTYSMQMRITNNNIQKLNRITGIKAALILLACDHPEAKEYLKYWGVSVDKGDIDEIKAIRQKLSADITSFMVHNASSEKEQKKDIDFFTHWGSIQKIYGQINYKTVSVAEWIGLLNAITKSDNGRDR